VLIARQAKRLCLIEEGFLQSREKQLTLAMRQQGDPRFFGDDARREGIENGKVGEGDRHG
jgi:hypothetical protein